MSQIGRDFETWIGSLGVDLYSAGARVADAGDTVSGWIWPFSLLNKPLYLLSSLLKNISEYVWSFRHTVRDVVDDVYAFWDTSELNNLINAAFGEWNYFRRDPKGYISSKLDELIPEFWKLRDNPYNWMASRIYIVAPDLWSWFVHPWDAWKLWLSQHYPSLYDLMINGIQGFISLVDMLSHEAYLLVTDPIEWLKDKFTQLLGWPYWFWSDPFGYLFESIMNYIDMHIGAWGAMLRRTCERILRYFWEGRI